MKKLFAVMCAAVLMTAGLATFAMSPASAACPYSGCIDTATRINAPEEVERGDRARICLRITSEGNARPRGTVVLTVVRSKGEFKFTDAKVYNEDRECFRTPRLTKRGNYVIKARFERKPGSRWQDSDNADEFRVVRRG